MMKLRPRVCAIVFLSVPCFTIFSHLSLSKTLRCMFCVCTTGLNHFSSFSFRTFCIWVTKQQKGSFLSTHEEEKPLKLC